jgi:hypothetical protein
MDPLSCLSIATGIITFVDFGAKVVSLYVQVRGSDDGRLAALSDLEKESRELSGNASHAQEKIASLQARYPRQTESLSRLAAECTDAEKDLRNLTDGLAAKPGHGFRARGGQVLVSLRGVLKQGDIEDLQDRLRGIREQTMMTVMMCIL